MKDGTVTPKYLELALPRCSADDFDGEIVAINLETGIYYSLKESAALIWHDLLDGHSLEALLGHLRDDDETRAAVAGFADRLIDSGLMRVSAAGRDPAGPARIASALPLSPPVLEQFGDMQDLLLLDPVHEVDDEIGWPAKPDPVR
jgi:hypothetical protein